MRGWLQPTAVRRMAPGSRALDCLAFVANKLPGATLIGRCRPFALGVKLTGSAGKSVAAPMPTDTT